MTIGLLGAAGFLGAVVHSLTRGWGARRRDDRPPHDRAALRDDLGLLVVVATLVATVSGGAIFLSLAGFSQVRVWNRMSLLIGFCALTFALTWLEQGWRLVRERIASTPARDRAWPRQAVGVALTAALVGFVLWDGAHVVVDHDAADATWEADRDYVAAIDDAMPDGTAVFQLPVTPFPEAGPVYDMDDYDHLRAFVHTEDARLLWSYGAMRGRPDGDWQQIVRDELGEVGSLPALLGAGFDGLWVDTFGYADRGAAVRAALDDATGVEPLVSADGRTLFYDLRPLRESLRESGTSDEDLRRRAEEELHLDLPG
jgi:phosphoglycerol transferase